MKAIRISETGGPDKLVLSDTPVPKPGPTDCLVQLEASGVNFIDVYHRTGLYKLDLPFTPGVEGAGVIRECGSEVIGFKPGDRVAWAMIAGAYAQFAVVPEAKLVAIPEGVSSDIAAAAMLQGMTAHYLTHSTYPIKPGDTALVHAAAGGTGKLVVQFAKQAGARVIAAVGSQEKAQLAKAAGADEAVLYDELRPGLKVDVVYDSVGAATWEKSLDSLKPRGMMVSFGNASGPVPPFPPALLAAKGSLYLTRPSLAQYIQTREELLWRSDELFSAILKGSLRISVDKTYPLGLAAEAHSYLEGRNTKGKLLLTTP